MNIVREHLKSVVIIHSSLGVGSGFYASQNGIIVTNAHVVGPLLQVSVRRYDKTLIESRVVRVATNYDLALLWDQSDKIPAPIPLGDPAAVIHGGSCYAIGHPVGLEFTVTRGIVSAASRMINGAYHVQTDAVAHPGSSGGPLLDEEGNVIGVSTFGLKQVDGLNFALSVRYVKELLGELIVRPAGGTTRRCVVCGAKNNMVRRSCRKCGVSFEAEPPATVSVPASVPDSVPPAMKQLLRCIEALEPAPATVTTRGLTAELSWRGCALTASVFPSAKEPYVSVTAFVADVEEGPRDMRRALEINLEQSLEAKLGLRGSQLYAAADRPLAGLDDVELAALFRRVVEVREAFLATAQAREKKSEAEQGQPGEG
jgi:hypothetical protein